MTGPSDSPALLGPAEIRDLADTAGIRPTKALGQNFLHDANTIRRIVRAARLDPDDVVLEVGPGLGSLTLGLLAVAARVVAVEIDPALAALLPATAAARGVLDGLDVVTGDALRLPPLPVAPTALVANLPYNVSVPVVLTVLEAMPTIRHGLVMVQAEVAERLAARAGEEAYGSPSVKLAWYAAASKAGAVPRNVFWPVPRVESGLVRLIRQPPPSGADRATVFAVIDAAFAQRRKMLRSALSGWAGSGADAVAILTRAGVDPTRRGETLSLADFVRIAASRTGSGDDLLG